MKATTNITVSIEFDFNDAQLLRRLIRKPKSDDPIEPADVTKLREQLLVALDPVKFNPDLYDVVDP